MNNYERKMCILVSNHVMICAYRAARNNIGKRYLRICDNNQTHLKKEETSDFACSNQFSIL